MQADEDPEDGAVTVRNFDSDGDGEAAHVNKRPHHRRDLGSFEEAGQEVAEVHQAGGPEDQEHCKPPASSVGVKTINRK